MENWTILRKGADFAAIAKQFQIHPRVAALIRNRDIIGENAISYYLNTDLKRLHDAMLMKDMEKAVTILIEKIEKKKKIRIIGDYDIDGINAAYILKEVLTKVGGDADYDIPDRIMDGYGINKHLIDLAAEAGIDTILTCDNGIAASAEVLYAKEQGMTVIVTDHHEVPYEMEGEKKRYLLPEADAIVNPQQEDCRYPFKGICGAVVAYKLGQALYRALGKDEKEIEYLIQNAAIATIGDVMDLIDENRIIVKNGLNMLKDTNNEGLKALFQETEVDRSSVSSYHIGFVIGPCLNASGRLQSAKLAMQMLEATETAEAKKIAQELKALNDKRKDMTEKAVKEGLEKIETSALKEDKVLVVYLPECHESLAGIVAGRIRERYCKPVFVLTKGEESIKGSGRSIEAYHMYEKLTECKELLLRFGGHKMAAGLSLLENNIEPFREKINVLAQLKESDFIPKVVIDMQLPFSEISEAFIEEIKVLEPFGKGNEKPLFAEKGVCFLQASIIGKNKNVLKARVLDGSGMILEALCFGDIEEWKRYTIEKYSEKALEDLMMGKENPVEFALTYYPGVNEFRGKKTLQIVIQNYK